MEETLKIIEKCRVFAQQADALEAKAFEDIPYRNAHFVDDFNKLFEQYAYGKQNRTVSGLNFRQPARYDHINTCDKEVIEQVSKTRYYVTFEGKPQWKTIRFVLDKRQGEWKLIRSENYLGIANHGKDRGKEVWTKNKL